MSFTPSSTTKGKTVIKKICLAVATLVVIAFFGFLCYGVLGGPLPELPSKPITTPPTATTPIATEPVADFHYEILSAPPADGNPKDVTSKGSYTAPDASRSSAVIATVGNAELTNSQLQVYYRQEVYNYLSQNPDHGISLNHGLDVQMCTVSETPMTWQQYFLQRALTTWHIHQALALESDANDYGLDESYYAYLGSLQESLEASAAAMGFPSSGEMITEIMGAGVTVDNLIEYVRLYEVGYNYFDRTYLKCIPFKEETEAYYLANSDAYEQASGTYVSFRHILLLPEDNSKQAWEDCLYQAQTVRYYYNQKKSEATFSNLAFKYSQDTGSNFNGGLYADVRDGLFIDEINEWCFDESRHPGNMTMLKSDIGYHLLYFIERKEARYHDAELDLIAAKVSLLIPEAMSNYPLNVYYSTIRIDDAPLGEANRESFSQYYLLLHDLCQAFPNIFYERYSTVPLYIQQDYPHLSYGGGDYTIATHGCGICALTMAATYLTDTEHLVEDITYQFQRYGTSVGSSWTLLDDAPAVLGFYSQGRVTNWEQAKQALEDGLLVVSLQREGPFTTGGHYILLYGISEDGRVLVRDSDFSNHSEDYVDTDYYENGFPEEMVYKTNKIFWVLGPKVKQVPTCVHCGIADIREETAIFLKADYTCAKCVTALHLRHVYDTACNIDYLDQIKPPVLDDSIVIPGLQQIIPTFDENEETGTPADSGETT